MIRRRRNKKSAVLKGQLLLTIGILAMSALGYAIFILNQNQVERDIITLCRIDGEVARETAIVIDATDNYSQSQAILITKEIKKVLEDASVDERFTFYVLGERIGEYQERFSVCNPGDGRDKSELTSNKRRLRQKWEENFYHKIVDSVQGLIGEHVVERSPIMEMLKLVSLNTMYDSSARERQIILVSDMLHHTAQYSHYRQNANYESFKKMPYAMEVRPSLEGVELNILYLVRTKDLALQNSGHLKFWEKFVMNNGGQISRIKTVN